LTSSGSVSLPGLWDNGSFHGTILHLNVFYGFLFKKGELMENNSFYKIKKVLWMILLANLVVAALKILIGYSIKSTSLTADGFHSLTDGSSNIVGLIGIHFASKPVDDDHPYGHGKFETLAGMFIALMLFLMGLNIIFNAISILIKPVVPLVSAQSLLVLLLTLCINVFVSLYEYRQGKKLGSSILVLDSLHTRSDVLISIGVLFTLCCIKLGMPPIIDGFASLVVSCFVLHTAYEIFSETSSVLVDQAALDAPKIKETILSFPQVYNVHKIRSRRSSHITYIDLHILVEPDMSIESSHILMHQIEERLCKYFQKNIQAHIHLEPYYDC
jgi:cation diffusion facilitator family transporter